MIVKILKKKNNDNNNDNQNSKVIWNSTMQLPKIFKGS